MNASKKSCQVNSGSLLQKNSLRINAVTKNRAFLNLIFTICAMTSLSVQAQTDTSSDTSAVTELDEIVVEEEGEPETELPLGIGISGETLRSAPGSGGDPIRTMQSLPGMTFTNDEESLPAVRGSRPGDNYFQADFAPLDYIFHVDGLISVFNADLIESFDIYQSAYGPEFAGVTGGVFDVKLRDPKTDRFRTTVDIGLLQAGALVEGPISDTQSFYLAGRISYLDLFLADQIDEEDGIKIDKFPKYSDYQGKYVWKPREDNRLTVQFNGAQDTAQISIADDAEDIDTDPILAGRYLFDTLFHEQALVWDHNYSEKLSFKSLLSHTYGKEIGEFGGVGSYKLDDEAVLLKTRASYALSDSHELIVGAQVQRGDVDLDITAGLPPCGELDADCLLTGAEQATLSEKFKYSATQAYIKDHWYVTDQLTLYPGVAFQSENIRNNQFVEPRLAAEYALSEETILSAGVGQYQQSPDYLESSEEFGNPDLGYSNALHAQVGIQRFLANRWSVKSELYYKALDNLSTSDPLLNYSNDGKGHAYGLDTLIRKDLTDKLSGWASISLSQARRKDKRTGETFVFDYDQPVNVSLVGNYKFNEEWTLGAKLWAHSGAPVTPVVGANEDADRPGFYRPVYGKLNSDRFPTYHRIDLRIDRTFKRSKDNTMGAYFELLNILGTENAAGYDYNSDYTEKEIEPQLTGFFSFGFKATY